MFALVEATLRNEGVVSGSTTPIIQCVLRIKRMISSLSFLIYGNIKNILSDYSLLRSFNITPRFTQRTRIKEVRRIMPPPGWHNCNFYGAEKGIPGVTSSGGVLRNY